MMTRHDRYSPPETRLFAQKLRNRVVVVLGLWVLAALILNAFPPDRPVERRSEIDHFYYGSIGSDRSGGLPTKVLLLLPELFPEHLPEGTPHDLTAFGFIQQSGERLPIGFSTRRQIIDRSQINCGTCHTGTVRESADSAPVIIPAMPAVTVDLLSFYRFLFDVAADDRFTARTIIDALDARDQLGWFDPIVYRVGIPIMRDALLGREVHNAFLFEPSYTPFLPGRVNTFDTFKGDQFRHFYAAQRVTPDPDEMFGIVDFPAVWNQQPREGMWLHWDANQSSVRERNFSAAVGAGTLPQEMDIDALLRIEAWLRDLPPPEYPFAIDETLAEKGAGVYAARCAGCHDFGSPLIGQAIPLEDIGTDPHRLWSYTDTLRRAQIDYTSGYSWAFRTFRVTDGYATQPLDGIWARAPYLHNGAVPSIWDLLSPDAERPVAFEVGVDIYDQQRMGFQAARLTPAGDGFMTEGGDAYAGAHQLLDTRLKGNAATGHTGPRYGTDLGQPDKRGLIEYLKTK